MAPRKAQAIIKDPESQRKKRERYRKRKNGKKGKKESERDSVIEKNIGAGNEDRLMTVEEIEMGRSRSKKYGHDREKKLCRRKRLKKKLRED